jgi:acetyltransferase-like isoleucine patch superfamily enzyme
MDTLQTAREVRAMLWAMWKLRAADEIGTRVRLHGSPKVVNRGRITIGERTRFDSSTATSELVSEEGGHLDIEERCFINFGVSLSASNLVRIGARTHIGPYCMLLDNAYHHVEPELRLIRPESKPIILEENVWLAARVIVLPGVTIGKDSCVAAGSVVTKDIPPRTLAAGLPARAIRDI